MPVPLEFFFLCLAKTDTECSEQERLKYSAAFDVTSKNRRVACERDRSGDAASRMGVRQTDRQTDRQTEMRWGEKERQIERDGERNK